LKVVALNRGSGKEEVTGSMDLPAGVKPAVQGTVSGDFVAAVRAADGDAVVSWQFFERPKRGLPPGTQDTLPPTPGEPPPAAPVARSARQGTFRMNLATGETAAVEGVSVAVPRGPSAEAVPAANRLRDVSGPQILSADGRHILTSTRTGDDRVWEKYTLAVHERGTGKRLGEFKSHVAVVPFFVTDSQVVYETAPYTRRTDAGLAEEPAKLRAVDLQTGKELWSRPVRETAYRGPVPP
jgi:hypothetical protein